MILLSSNLLQLVARLKRKRGEALLILLFLLIFSSVSCSKDDLIEDDTLAYFLDNSDGKSVQDSSVIACAAGEVDSLNVYYYPAPNFSDFRLWQLTTPTADPSDFTEYKEVEYPLGTLFNGYLAYFIVEALEAETWVIVTGSSEEELVVAQPIRLKQKSVATEINPEVLSIDLSEPLEPRFSWKDGGNTGTAIYFHVVSNADGDLISGTYTFDKFWQFYDLSNVVLNIRDVSPPPQLENGETYTFSMMGVSQDNWVNMLVEAEFTAG